MEPLHFTVPADGRHVRVDKVLSRAFPEYTRAAIQRAFVAGLVTCNGKQIKPSHEAGPGDVLECTLPEVAPMELKAVKIALDVIFEDKHLIAINKASGMVVHPGAATGEDTLVHALLAHCKGTLSGIGGVERPGIVHRLDRETSGLILVAKTDKAHNGLATQFSERTLHKEYLALVAGIPSLLSGSIRSNIGRDPKHRHRMAAIEDDKGGKESRTDWKVEESFPYAALLRCELFTGRTHQIRVHLKSTGHAIMGDSVYGWKPDPKVPFVAERVMLHSERIAFKHPVTGKAMDLQAPLPKDFKAALKALRASEKAARQAPKASAARPQRKL